VDTITSGVSPTKSACKDREAVQMPLGKPVDNIDVQAFDVPSSFMPCTKAVSGEL
jgi:hypothetical protein